MPFRQSYKESIIPPLYIPSIRKGCSKPATLLLFGKRFVTGVRGDEAGHENVQNRVPKRESDAIFTKWDTDLAKNVSRNVNMMWGHDH